MNGRFPMQGCKNWILQKDINANRFFWDSHWLEIWTNHLCPSMGANGGRVAMDSGHRLFKDTSCSCISNAIFSWHSRFKIKTKMLMTSSEMGEPLTRSLQSFSPGLMNALAVFFSSFTYACASCTLYRQNRNHQRRTREITKKRRKNEKIGEITRK